MGCGGCGGGRKDINIQRPQGRKCSRCGWIMNRVHKFSQITKSMIEQWVCPNQRCNNVEAGR